MNFVKREFFFGEDLFLFFLNDIVCNKVYCKCSCDIFYVIRDNVFCVDYFYLEDIICEKM